MNNSRCKQKQKSSVNSRFASVFESKIPRKHKVGYAIWPEVLRGYKRFTTFDIQAVSGHVVDNHRSHKYKQTRPIGRNKYRKAPRAIQQNTSKSLFKKTFSFLRSPGHRVRCRLIPHQKLFQFSFPVKRENLD